MNAEQRNLTAYEFENKWLNMPEALATFYLDEQVICSTPAGYCMFPLDYHERELFQFGELVDMEHLEDAEAFIETYVEEIEWLEGMCEKLLPLGLAAVSFDLEEESCILTSLDGRRYFVLSAEAAEQLNADAAAALLQMPVNTFENPHVIRK